MLIITVLLVFVNILTVKTKTENDVVKIIIKQGTQGNCSVHKEKALTFGTNFNLEVISELFIMEGNWTYKDKLTVLKDLENSTIRVTYNKKKHGKGSKPSVTLKYYYSHTREVNENIEGNWKFSFKYLKDYNPWSLDYKNVGNCECDASVKLKNPLSRQGTIPGTENGVNGPKNSENVVAMPAWAVYVLSLFGLFLVVQSSYIIYGKVKGCRTKSDNDKDPISPKSPKSPKGKRSKTRRNIADRPPLPLPSDEVIQTPPQPPISPGPVHRHLFPTAPPMPVENSYIDSSDPVLLVSKPSDRHQGLNTPHEGVKSPVFDRRQQGPLVPKQSYRNKALEASLEELRTPGFPRRHMDGPLVQKQSYRSKALDASFEELRTPGCHRRYMDGPIVPKPTYRNSVCISEDSDEEHKAPGFARRQIEANFTQLPPKGVAPSKSFKLPRPLPRSPPSPKLERVPPFNPAHRPDPVPPLHPKKVPAFPPPAPFRKQDSSRLSDDEWQYEQLQPSSKYLNNNFSTTNNFIR